MAAGGWRQASGAAEKETQWNYGSKGSPKSVQGHGMFPAKLLACNSQVPAVSDPCFEMIYYMSNQR